MAFKRSNQLCGFPWVDATVDLSCLPYHLSAIVNVTHEQAIFICHSLGGLIAKQMLLDNPQYAEKAPFMVFHATPSSMEQHTHRCVRVPRQSAKHRSPWQRPAKDLVCDPERMALGRSPV